MIPGEFDDILKILERAINSRRFLAYTIVCTPVFSFAKEINVWMTTDDELLYISQGQEVI
jgi:hypothetical protein